MPGPPAMAAPFLFSGTHVSVETRLSRNLPILSPRRNGLRPDEIHVPALRSTIDVHGVIARFRGGDALLRGVEVVVVVLLAVQAARLAWLLLPPAPLGTPPAQPQDRHGVPHAHLAIDAFHPAPATADADADTSGLRLFALRPGSLGGSAIVAMADGPQRAWLAGEEIAPGVVLAEVHADHAVLEAGGRRSLLRFAAAHKASGTSAGRAVAQAARAPMATVSATTGPPGTSDPGIDPAALLAEAGLSPVESDGGAPGYTIIPRGDGAALRQAGLQAGDVLLSVNGQALTPERYAELPAELAGASTITLTYRRDGQVRSARFQARTP